MKIIERSIGNDDKVLTETSGTLIIQSGNAFFLIREIDPCRIVVLCPENDPGETVYRMLIEPVSGHAFQVTQWVIPHKEY
jgi:hypothetical protein